MTITTTSWSIDSPSVTNQIAGMPILKSVVRSLIVACIGASVALQSAAAESVDLEDDNPSITIIIIAAIAAAEAARAREAANKPPSITEPGPLANTIMLRPATGPAPVRAPSTSGWPSCNVRKDFCVGL